MFLCPLIGLGQQEGQGQKLASDSEQVPINKNLAIKVSGKLLERGTKKPLVGVNIFVLPHKIKMTTKEGGHFEAVEIPVGESDWVINLTGYKKFTQKIDLKEGFEGKTFYLEKKSYNQFETTIVGKNEKRDDGTKSLSQEEFLTVPGAGGDPVKAVQNLPGINRSSGGNAQVVIQGAEPEDTGYLLDGHEIPVVFHFGGLSSVVMPEAVSSVDYLSAGYGPEYGGVLGGFVGLNTRSAESDQWKGFGFVDLFNVGGLVEGPIDEKSELLVSGRYSYIGFIFQQVAKGNDDFDLTVAPTFADFTSIYSREFSRRSKFKSVLIASRDELEFVTEDPVDVDASLRGNFRQVTEFIRLIPQWNYEVDSSSKLKLSLGVGNDHVLFDVGEQLFDLTVFSVTLRGEYEKEVSSSYKYYLGIDQFSDWFDVDFKFDFTPGGDEGGVSNPLSSGDQNLVNTSGRQFGYGTYLRNQINFDGLPRWTFFPSLRIDHYTQTDETLFQPRYSMRYELSKYRKLRFAAGLYGQNPENQQTDETIGNANLKPQRSVHYTMGYSHDFREGRNHGWNLNGGVFYKTLDRLVVSTDTTDDNGQFNVFANEGTGSIIGLELSLGWSNPNWSAKLAYTLTRSRREEPGVAEHPSAFDQTHSVNLIAAKKGEKWNFSTRVRYVTGNPVTPVIGAVFDSDNDVFLPIRGDLFSDRLKPFFQIDFRADRKWIYDTYILSIYFDVQNLTNQKNEEARIFSSDFSQQDAVSGLPILPTFGFKGEF